MSIAERSREIRETALAMCDNDIHQAFGWVSAAQAIVELEKADLMDKITSLLDRLDELDKIQREQWWAAEEADRDWQEKQQMEK